MGLTTKIEWCDSTCNPVVGCDGCELHKAGDPENHCYAAALVNRYTSLPGWPTSFDRPEFFPGRIEAALKWPDLTGKERPGKPWLNGYPRLIFLCDLADPFSESLPAGWLSQYLRRMGASPHVWILLTKRPAWMRQFFERFPCPPNLWLLTSVTSAANRNRLDELLEIPGATVRGVSYEPALGPVDLAAYLPLKLCNHWPGQSSYDSCDGQRRRSLNWIIAGGESGPGARPAEIKWFRDVRDQCVAAGVPFFMKQMGGRRNKMNVLEDIPADLRIRECPNAQR